MWSCAHIRFIIIVLKVVGKETLLQMAKFNKYSIFFFIMRANFPKAFSFLIIARHLQHELGVSGKARNGSSFTVILLGLRPCSCPPTRAYILNISIYISKRFKRLSRTSIHPVIAAVSHFGSSCF